MNRNSWLVALGLLLVGYGTNVATPFLVLYRDRLSLGQSQTMAIFAVYVLGIFSTLIVAGPLSDRLGRRALALPFTLLSAVASIVLILGRDSFGLLLLGRLLLGSVSGAVFGVGAAWLQELMGPGNEATAALVATAMTYGGFGLGPPISALIDYLTDTPLVISFLVHAGLTVAFVPFLWRVPETVVPNRQSVRPRLGVPTKNAKMFVRVVMPAALMVFVFPSAAFALFPVLVSDAIGGAEVAVAAASGALTAWSGLLARPTLKRFGPRVAIPIGMSCGTLGYGLGTLGFVTDLWPLVLPASVLLGAASGTLTAAALRTLGEMAEPESRGALNSTFYLMAYLGMATPLFITTVAALGPGLVLTLLFVTTVGVLATIWTYSGLRVDFARAD